MENRYPKLLFIGIQFGDNLLIPNLTKCGKWIIEKR
jgi:hypothetical protein